MNVQPFLSKTNTRAATAATLLRLDASVRTDGSVSRSLADAAEEAFRAGLPEAAVVRRDLGRAPLAALWPEAIAASAMAEAERSRAARAAYAAAKTLVDELLAADAYLFAVPMYNFGPPQQVKHWIDMIICDPRANDVHVPLLRGRPALLLQVCGGAYGPGTARAGYDHLTPYLRCILADVWGLALTTVTVELTAAAHSPAMQELRAQAARNQEAGHASACAHAEAMARGLARRRAL
ncbi:MAG: NAD(P)H-dependent oxidoreductase [Polyangiales bacterium]